MADADWEGVRFNRRSFAAGTGALVAAACGPHIRPALASPMIVVDQPDALVDAAIAIELRGFPPRQPVTVTRDPDAFQQVTLARPCNFHERR